MAADCFQEQESCLVPMVKRPRCAPRDGLFTVSWPRAALVLGKPGQGAGLTCDRLPFSALLALCFAPAGGCGCAAAALCPPCGCPGLAAQCTPVRRGRAGAWALDFPDSLARTRAPLIVSKQSSSQKVVTGEMGCACSHPAPLPYVPVPTRPPPPTRSLLMPGRFLV